MGVHGLTRRQLFGRGGVAVAGAGGLAAAGAAGYARPWALAAAITSLSASAGTRKVLHFVSRPDLSPPALTIANYRPAGASDPPYFILTPSGYPRSGPGTPGLMILDRHGGIVWYSPNTGFPASKGMARIDLKVQSYRDKPVLTWWEGNVARGVGEGKAIIADTSYRTIATVSAGDGLQVDLHDFVISPQDTALVTAYRPVRTDLSQVRGPTRGVAMSGVVQEIDIPSGRVLFEWSSLDYVPVTDTYVPFYGGTAAEPFDYFHINSISIAPDGDLLLSGRNTSAVYKVSRSNGHVAWRLGGKRSSFAMGPGTRFWFQHHVLSQGQDTLSIFDDGGTPPKEPRSRAILLSLDTGAMRATLQRSYAHPAGLAAANQGSVQVLADGEVLVGWGNLPYFSQFTAKGALILDGQFPVGDQSYRAFTAAWTGHPTDKPAAAARVNPAGGSVVYASWNGATEVNTWTVLAGRTADALAKVGSQPRSGFETVITVNSKGPYFAVTAQDAGNHVLGRSATVRIKSG
ncbi:MAG: arylsulfotransferase family protein [Streptosporangiaceae bacterium]